MSKKLKANKTGAHRVKVVLIILGLILGIVYGFAIFLLEGGPSHLVYINKPAPALGSDSLQGVKSDVKAKQQQAISFFAKNIQATQLGNGHVDVCVHGFEGGMGKSGTNYVYKCVYRTNIIYSMNGSFLGILSQIEEQLPEDGWISGDNDVMYIRSEYKDRVGDIKNAVNSLPNMYYRKDRQLLEIVVADTDPAKKDTSYPVWSQIDDPSQTIRAEINGERIYEDENFISNDLIIQKAEKKNHQYIIMLSSEEEYFMN